ncbi:MAG: PAS domain S-box protein [Deltaproteobacteria bacterium]|nr:PAS domain S-box protein [Deltaproteobacteria bacterium]
MEDPRSVLDAGGGPDSRFRALFDSPFHYTALLAPDGELLDVNRRALAEGGLPREAVLGLPFWELGWWGGSPEVQSRVRRAIARAAGGELVREDEDVCEDEDSLFVVELLLVPVHDNQGRVAYLIAEAQDVTWRKEAQSALRLSEERFRTAMRFSAIGMALVATDGRFVEVNHALCRIVGYTEDELRATDFQSITHPDDLDTDVAYMHAMLRHEIETYQMEKRYFHKDGRVIWILLSVSMVSGSDGAPLHFIAQIQDITERKQVESELRVSEERFRSAMRFSAIGMALVAPDGRFLEVNHELCRILGYSEDELRASDFQSITHPDDIEAGVANVGAMLRREIETYRAEKRYIHGDGHVVWATLNASLVRDSDGAPLYFVSQIQDVTESKHVESALRASEERFRAIMGGSAAGMAMVALDGHFREVNSAYCRILGYTEAELRMTNVQSISHPDDLAEELVYINAMLRREREMYQMEKRFFHKDGRLIWILASVSMLVDTDGATLYFVSQIDDITARKQAELQRPRD